MPAHPPLRAAEFGAAASGNAESMSEPNSGSNDSRVNDSDVSEGGAKGSRTDGGRTGDGGGPRAAVRMTAFTPHGAERAMGLEPGDGPSGWVAAGRRAVLAAPGQTADLTRTAWTAVARHKPVTAGAGVGLAVALSAGSYVLGRRAERRARGPLTRLTGGRF
jgi:hypothetical protein